jgi:hypothetical protein
LGDPIYDWKIEKKIERVDLFVSTAIRRHANAKNTARVKLLSREDKLNVTNCPGLWGIFLDCLELIIHGYRAIIPNYIIE